jgi:subtilisin-like proprotein convertase family protein
LLASFNGLDANGAWTLQAIDFHEGGVATLHNWNLTITGSAVPEPVATTSVAGVLLLTFACVRKFRRRS